MIPIGSDTDIGMIRKCALYIVYIVHICYIYLYTYIQGLPARNVHIYIFDFQKKME